MRSMQSNKKRFDKIIRPKGRSSETIENLVRKVYESFSKKEKEFIDDPEQAIKVLTNTIMVEGETGKVNPYQTWKNTIKDNKRKKHRGTLEQIWSDFKTQKQQLYNKYNSYMFRRGYKSTSYFFENAQTNYSGSIWEVVVELPEAPSGRISYTTLYIEYDFSDGVIKNAIMHNN